MAKLEREILEQKESGCAREHVFRHAGNGCGGFAGKILFQPDVKLVCDGDQRAESGRAGKIV